MSLRKKRRGINVRDANSFAMLKVLNVFWHMFTTDVIMFHIVIILSGWFDLKSPTLSSLYVFDSPNTALSNDCRR